MPSPNPSISEPWPSSRRVCRPPIPKSSPVARIMPNSCVDELGASAVLLYYLLTGELSGRESLKQMIRQLRTAFPDASFSLEDDFAAEGDKVVARWKGVATPKGAFGGIPATGKSAPWTGISIFRIADGKVAEEIVEEEALSVFQQLGVVPPLG